MTLVKVCGLTTVEDALSFAGLDIDMVGLVFAPSSRQISPGLAKDIAATLYRVEGRPAVAGVFVNEDPHVVNEIAARCRLDIVQLSGDESWDYCRQIEYPIIKAVHVLRTSRGEDIIARIGCSQRAELARPFICLLDSREGLLYGGTGQAFDWDLAREAAARFPLMIAGGLTPANVGGLIARVKPLGVDVSSGVETKGRKDISKIQNFINAVRSVEGVAEADRQFLKTFLSKGGDNVT